MEIERKFLLKKPIKKYRKIKEEKIYQGYLSIDQYNEVRIRKIKTNKNIIYNLGIKSIGKISRQEIEILINKDYFDKIWPLTKGRRLVKKRKTFILNNIKIYIDEYQGKLKGLIVAEVEFKTYKDAMKFKKPIWFGKEVSNLDNFKNRNLINESFSSLKERL